MNSYFRLDYTTARELDSWMREGRLPESPIDLSTKVRGGNFVHAAKFNVAARQAATKLQGQR